MPKFMKNAVRTATGKKAEQKIDGMAGSASCRGPAGGGGGFILRMNSLRRVHAISCRIMQIVQHAAGPSAKGGGFTGLATCR